MIPTDISMKTTIGVRLTAFVTNRLSISYYKKRVMKNTSVLCFEDTSLASPRSAFHR